MSRSNARFEWAVRYAVIVTLITPFIGGPSVPFGPLDFILFDGALVILCLVCVPYVLANQSQLSIVLPQSRLLLGAAGIYLTLAIALPVGGQVFFGHPIGYFVGDLRWIQALMVAGATLLVYEKENVSELFADIALALKAVVLIHMALFGIQLLAYVGIVDTVLLVDLWQTNQSAYGTGGFRNGRFIAAALTPSLLGLSSAITLVFFAVTVARQGTGGIYLLLAVILLIASGHRTSMVGVAGSVVVIVGYFALYQRSAAVSLRYVATSLGAVVIGGYLAMTLGFGGQVDRYEEILSIMTGERTILEASDRDGRWGPALERAADYEFGTLSNPSWVFQDLEPVDSYFVLAYIQGSWPFLGSYIIFLFMVGVTSLRLLIIDSRAMIPFALLPIIVAQSLMQNFMTSIAGKMILIITLVVVIYLCLQHYEGTYTLTT